MKSANEKHLLDQLLKLYCQIEVKYGRTFNTKLDTKKFPIEEMQEFQFYGFVLLYFAFRNHETWFPIVYVANFSLWTKNHGFQLFKLLKVH
ncbi:hypothetical protein P8452_33175 [Trifolium repens]|nr:hypothetical protein P8452_33175 [Trifolium repens]